MTSALARAAASEGQSKGQDSVLLDPLYQAMGDRVTWIGFTPSCLITTPFHKIAFAAAKARTTYAPEPTALMQQSLLDHELEIDAILFNPVLNVNSRAAGVIKQGALIIRAGKQDKPDQDVVDDPQVGYRTALSFYFDLRRLALNQPFDFVVANIPVYNGTQERMDGEVVCHFDGSKFR